MKRIKKVLIVTSLIIIIISLLIHYYFYSNFWENLFYSNEKCEIVIEYMNGLISGLNSIDIKNSSEKSMSNICDIKNSEIIDSTTFYEISFCDLDKIKTGLESPNNLDLDDLRTYIAVSDKFSIKQVFILLKKIYEKEFSKGCNNIRALSAPIYNIITTGTEGLVYTNKEGFLSTCLNQKNFTDEEKKDCIISILNAEKSATDYYSNLDYTGDVQKCVDLMSQTNYPSIYGNEIPSSLSKSVIDSICKKMIEYRKQLLEEVKKIDIDFNQKYFIISGLYLQEIYIGKEDVSTQFQEDLKERIANPKYQNLFIVS